MKNLLKTSVDREIGELIYLWLIGIGVGVAGTLFVQDIMEKLI